tara:strand:+ start:987 stop:1889 length:903 start_codon:yes stop_codon:yes gene_type:complete
MSDHRYEFDELVIGTGLNAVLYSFLNQKPLIINSTEKPLFFEFFPDGFDLSKLAISLDEYLLKGLKRNIKVGASKLDVWERLVFCLSLSGLLPLHAPAAEIRIEENYISVSTQDFKVHKLRYKKLRIFNDANLIGLPECESHIERYKVIDWMDVRSGMLHPYDYLNNGGFFVKELYFYPSERIDGDTDKKDLVAVSELEKKYIDDFDFSGTMARFKVIKTMKKADIRGARNGRDTKNPGKYKYYAVKVEPTKREIRKLYFPKYKNKENLIFDYRTEEKIYESYDITPGYCNKINRMIAER